MATLRPFRGIRPVKDKMKQIASKPYDVLDANEARIEAKDNPLSFYHVIKPEIDFSPATNPYSPEIYKQGKKNMEQFIQQKLFFQDEKDCLYIYQQTMDGRKQTGIVGCASVNNYFNGIIKKHELTRADKEEDRKNHVRESNMNYEPVFFAYPSVKEIDEIVNRIIQEKSEYNFVADDGIAHTFWVIKNDEMIKKIVSLFEKIPFTYIADGHHRTAAAALVGKEKGEQNSHHTGKEEYNFFLAVHFPDNQLKIFDYNRAVKDLNDLSDDDFLRKVAENFFIEEKGKQTYRPDKLHNFGIYLNGNWYSLTAKPGTYNDNDPIGVLDVTILSEKILAPILNIHDLRKDKRIDFIGGIRGLGELEKIVDSGKMKVAFALYPVTMKQLIDIADSGKIMPPKTTWFEPKLRSGLVIHSLLTN
ncbi:MAG: DUF1015 family protein [Bacteroidota bacterium]